MTTKDQTTVFVCGPSLCGEVLNRVTVRNGEVVWEQRAERVPQPAEPIRHIHHIPVSDRLVLLVTDEALYLTTVDDLVNQPSLLAKDVSPEGRPPASP